jgi:hypothetical protein
MVPENDGHVRPNASVDVVPMTIVDDELCVLLSKRTHDPFEGRLALVGTYVHVDEDASCGDAARRVLRDRLAMPGLYVEQLSTFSGPTRDPRGWSISVAYFSVCPSSDLRTAVDGGWAELVPVSRARGLPFDHDLIVEAAVSRIRGKGAYSDIPARLAGPVFSLAELHHAYSVAMGDRINYDAFRRKVLERGFLEQAGERAGTAQAKRPTTLWRLKDGQAVFDRPF